MWLAGKAGVGEEVYGRLQWKVKTMTYKNEFYFPETMNICSTKITLLYTLGIAYIEMYKLSILVIFCQIHVGCMLIKKIYNGWNYNIFLNPLKF